MTKEKGSHGGAREGAGRKPKPPEPAPETADMHQFLIDVALGRINASHTQVNAAIAALRHSAQSAKKPGGKKEERQQEAEEVSSKFGPRPAPLKVVGG